MRIGIFFGGASREREISFAGGRTVYDNLDKNLFEAVPIFIDSLGNFILLDWKYIYKGTIRDFYPPVAFAKPSADNFQIYAESLTDLSNEELEKMIASVGKKISIEELKDIIDLAFLALHGAGGEDGSIQGIFEWLNIPYSGSGILSSAIGMNKAFQKNIMRASGFDVANSIVMSRDEWLSSNDHEASFQEAKKKLGLPFVVRPANQGSSIGVSIVRNNDGGSFKESVDAAFFIRDVPATEWINFSSQQKIDWVRSVSEIKDGIGIPFLVNGERINHPDELLNYINNYFTKENHQAADQTSISGNTSSVHPSIRICSIYEEQEILLESFIAGTEFSCIVIRNENGAAIALPPTEIKKGNEVFDYRSKYLAGITRKVTPIDLPEETIEKIRKECEELFTFFHFQVYARIDGFIDGEKILLNDPNTTSGMLPSSFFFHQAAEIGLNPSQFLTYIIRTSIAERIRSQTHVENFRKILFELDENISNLKNKIADKRKIAVILGGYSSERHISVESGRNIFEKLSSSTKYEPVPLFLIGDEKEYSLYQVPVNLLLKDNADDIRDKILHFRKHAVIEKIKIQCKELTSKYGSGLVVFEPKNVSLSELSEMVHGVFIALHGRPGEDGRLQSDLEKFGLPYNGSGVESSQLTINKYKTNEILRENGFMIADHLLMKKNDWERDSENFYEVITSHFAFPFICKPVDDGCSSAVKKIHSKKELDAFCKLLFRNAELLPHTSAQILNLKSKEEFPRKQELLIEELISRNKAKQFLEITGGMLTSLNGGGEIRFEIFEPSEAMASEDVLSLEEKFLAGQGQNITPARFATDKKEYERIASAVKKDFEKAARILNIKGYCRIDAFVRVFEDEKIETIIIEVNSLPGMTPATCIFHQAAIHEYKPFDFIDKILEFSFQKQRLATTA